MLKPTVVNICTDLAVASTATVYTDAIEVNYEEVQTLYASAAATTGQAIDVEIEVEYSLVEPMANVADGASIVDPAASALSVSGTSSAFTLSPFSPVVSMYLRFKITGVGSNHSSTTVTLNICKKDKVN